MTRPDLDALAALLERATPGPWTDDPNGEARNVRSPDGGIVAQMGHLRGWHGAGGRKPKTEPPANAALIVAAVNALPSLIAYVRELERKCGPRPDLSGSTHWDIADAGAVCHDECAVAQIKAAAEAMRERCAEICSKAARERTSDPTSWATAADCAAAIRALEV